MKEKISDFDQTVIEKPTEHFENYEVIPYGYSILDYAREYDEEWREIIKILYQLYQSSSAKLKKKEKKRIEKKKASIPKEVIFEIMQYLDDLTLVAMSGVCREWNFLASKDCLWENHLILRFKVSPSCLTSSTSNKKKLKLKKTHCTSFEGDPTAEIDLLTPKQLYKKMYQSYLKVIEEEIYHGSTSNFFQNSRSGYVPSSFFSGNGFAR
jgi:hypothetical protein